MTTKRSDEIKQEPAAPTPDLMYFDRAEPRVHFGLPAHPTVEQQLIYYSRFTDTRNEDLYIRLWHSARTLIKDWECSLMPDISVNLKSISDPAVATIIMWVGQQVTSYINGLDALPKV